MDKLIISRGRGERQLVDLDRPHLTIGRADTSDLPMTTMLASRVHALVSWHADGVYVTDLDSANGTYVNGRKITKHLLQHRDVIRVGDCDMRFLQGRAAGLSTPSPATLALVPA